MKFTIFVYAAAAVFASQANSQLSGIVRPFIAGYTNGIAEFAKPFVQLGQSVVPPPPEYFPSVRPRRPHLPSWLVYPAATPVVSRPQALSFEPFDILSSPSVFSPHSTTVHVVGPRPFDLPAISTASQDRPAQPFGPPSLVPASSSSSPSISSESFENSQETIQPLPSSPLLQELPSSAASSRLSDDQDVPPLKRPLTLDEN